MFSLFKNRKAPLYAAIDVGSHAVKAVIFEKTRDKKNPKVLKKIIMKLPPAFEPIRMVHKLREILFVVVKELGRIPEKLVIAFGTSLAAHTFEVWNAGTLSAEEVSAEALGRLFKSIADSHISAGRFIFAYPIEALVNGYTVAYFKTGNWISAGLGKNGASGEIFKKIALYPGSAISFRALILTCAEDVGEGLLNLKKSFGGMPIEFIPISFAHQHAATRVLGYRDVMLIDIGGEMTVLAEIQESVIGEIASIEVGGRNFVRGIARVAGISFDEAEDLKRQYASDQISEERKKMIRSFIGQEADFWKKKFLESLDAFYRLGPLPPEVLLFGGGSNLEDIASYLREGGWLEDFSYAKSATVRLMRGSDLFDGSSLKGFLQGPDEFAIGSLIHYALEESNH
ncbi:MAG: hypothetical protein HYT98_02150 [Candidatus Sungbacteria bacterium]|nr:hypothetical protein [Candidatus Sungbacteria bacterium]